MKKQIEERNDKAGVQMKRSASTESLATGGSRDSEPIVGPGLSSDVNRELGEMVDEARQTWQERERMGKGKGKGLKKHQ